MKLGENGPELVNLPPFQNPQRIESMKHQRAVQSDVLHTLSISLTDRSDKKLPDTRRTNRPMPPFSILNGSMSNEAV